MASWLAVSLIAIAGCGGGSGEAPQETAEGIVTPDDAADQEAPPPDYQTGLPEGVRSLLFTPFTGDLDGMVERRLIRVGTTYSRTFYFVDQGEQRGLAYEMGKTFEDELNRKLKTGNRKVNVVFVPLPRDLLAAALLDGKIDLAAAQVIVRPELQELVDFTNPTRTDVSEVVVTGPGGPAITSVEDLSGLEVYARRDSSSHASLLELNQRLAAKELPPVVIQEAPESLEDEDLLEMVNAGILPAIVVHDYLAEFWKQVFPDLTVHGAAPLRTGASLAVPIRKASPLLAAELNGFLAKHGLGTLLGNMLEKRYLQNASYVKNAASETERKKFLELAGLFKRYAEQYQLDFTLMAAQGYQESGLDQNVRSAAGAVGIMQLMPATGAELGVGDITEVEANIHAGVKYVRFMIDRYYADEPMDELNKGLFAIASYNAGPAKIRKLRAEAEQRGLDPNVWFGNVEQIASERIGRETVTYVANIYKYYIAFRAALEAVERREAAKAEVTEGAR
ncbi:MAG: transporter substrate-binding domain-containing protein [Thermoanaerobaculales bacterium]|jgi:membrane-bound lytic murein transglycosylase MltF|nr:transporter substrate-binding domain-containing protein [Thermoanaerobaculales bacterium]